MNPDTAIWRYPKRVALRNRSWPGRRERTRAIRHALAHLHHGHHLAYVTTRMLSAGGHDGLLEEVYPTG